MNILGIDSSGLVATTALMMDGKLVSNYSINNKKTHSQTLLPMICDMLEMADVKKEDLDGIAVAKGPGSFTGLRIGAATAKGIAMALDIPIIEVSSLMGLAFNVKSFGGVVCPIMDARRKQVYYGIYNVANEVPEALTEDGVDDVTVLLDNLIPQICPEEKIMFLGDGVFVYRDVIEEHLGDRAVFADSTRIYQDASSVAYIGEKKMTEGEVTVNKDFAPSYIRKSQAQRELENKKNGDGKC